MITIKVSLADGDSLTTRFNGTLEEAKAYYEGTALNLGVTEDRMVKVTGVIPITAKKPNQSRA